MVEFVRDREREWKRRKGRKKEKRKKRNNNKQQKRVFFRHGCLKVAKTRPRALKHSTVLPNENIL